MRARDGRGRVQGVTRRSLLGGKGANLAEMSGHRPAGAAGFHDQHRSLHPLLCQQPGQDVSTPDLKVPPWPMASAPYRTISTKDAHFGDPGGSAAGVGAVGRARVDARDDGYRAQSRASTMHTVGRPGHGLTGDARFAWDSATGGFIQMYSDVVLGLDHHRSSRKCAGRSIKGPDNGCRVGRRYRDAGMNIGRHMVALYTRRSLPKRNWASPFPQDVHEQLWGAIAAVFDSHGIQRSRATSIAG